MGLVSASSYNVAGSDVTDFAAKSYKPRISIDSRFHFHPGPFKFCKQRNKQIIKLSFWSVKFAYR
jgi:hypothetical protein